MTALQTTVLKCDEWAKKDSRVKVIHKKNGGVSSARNEGLKKAKGTYVLFVDSDDEIMLTCCEDLLNAILKDGTDLAVGGLLHVDEEKNIQKLLRSAKRDLILNFDNKKHFFKFDRVANIRGPVCKLYKKSIIKNEFDLNLSYGEDAVFNIQYYASIKKVSVVNKTLYKYYVVGTSLTNYDKDNNMVRDAIIAPMLYENALKITKDKKISGYFSVAPIVRFLYFYVQALLVRKCKNDEIVEKVNEKLDNELIKKALELFHPLDYKTRMTYNCLKKRNIKKLIFICKTKMFINKIIGKKM